MNTKTTTSADPKEKKTGKPRRKLTARETAARLKELRRQIAIENSERIRKAGITPEDFKRMGITAADIESGRIEIR